MADSPRHQRYQSSSALSRIPKRGLSSRGVRLWVRGAKVVPTRASARRPSRWQRVLSLLLTALLLWGAMTLLVFSLRWSLQLILNPEALPWLQARLFPGQTLSNGADISTLDTLTEAAAAQGQTLGSPLILQESNDSAPEFWVIPVQAAPTTPKAPDAIVELRLYRRVPDRTTTRLQALATLPARQMPEAAILEPLLRTPQKILPADQAFPMTQVSLLPASPTQGFWLTLRGQWQRGSTTLRYGQLVYLDSRKRTLEALTAWSTPTNALPHWADLDGKAPADLLIDETVGLEPAFAGYRLQPKQGLGPAMQLVPVTLAGVPTDLNDSKGAYYRALSLARSGLWSEALRQFQALKPKLGKQWTPAAEAQLQLVKVHADRTQQQAERNWSIPSQQILANLIDGRWEKALQQLEAKPATQEALMRILAQDEGRFWNRVSAALRLHPKDPAIQVWGGLILKAQQDQQTALAWLNQQKVLPATRSRFWMAANPPAAIAKAPTPAASAAIPVSTAEAAPAQPVEALLGLAVPLASVNLSQWEPLQAGQAPQLADQETWYQVEVFGWQQAGNWTAVSPTSATALRGPLAPAVANIQVVVPGQGIITVRSHGLQVVDNRLRLLAAGNGQAAGVAASAGSLLWLDSLQGRPAGTQEQALKALQDALAEAGLTVSDAELSTLAAQTLLYPLDVTGDGQEDWVLTLPSGSLQPLGQSCDGASCSTLKTLIVNAKGRRLYSDLFLSQSLAALTQPNFSQPVALLVQQNSQYSLWFWSSNQQQFE